MPTMPLIYYCRGKLGYFTSLFEFKKSEHSVVSGSIWQYFYMQLGRQFHNIHLATASFTQNFTAAIETTEGSI